MKNTIFAAVAMLLAFDANAQGNNGFVAEKINACRKSGEMAAATYELYKESPGAVGRARGLHPVNDRAIDAMQKGIVSDKQGAFQLGMAYCFDYIDEQAAKR
ncbi:hypothetical protein [Noviherbaspirillum sedimenti]|uniref:Uncharacterized protein n=1 Tax=Noviherbaspirillum sedimenti TaxID=2320865 RepID=A0A3A3G4D5_9BURK|nr:hypothetical protein [Noviherbaspirillum sedimenti]RJG02525.1 hypothetical protein D3878_13855 [Noviherbaspirillum sedimenti]